VAGNWRAVLGYIAEAAEVDRLDFTTPPVVCPYDQVPLREGPGNVLFCPFAGDYEYPRDGIIK